MVSTPAAMNTWGRGAAALNEAAARAIAAPIVRKGRVGEPALASLPSLAT